MCEVGVEDYSTSRYKRVGILIGSQGRRGSLRIRGDQTPTTISERNVSVLLDIQPFDTANAFSSLERCDANENKAEI